MIDFKTHIFIKKQLKHRVRNSRNNPKTRSQLNAEAREDIVIPSEYEDFVFADSGKDDQLRVKSYTPPRRRVQRGRRSGDRQVQLQSLYHKLQDERKTKGAQSGHSSRSIDLFQDK